MRDINVVLLTVRPPEQRDALRGALEGVRLLVLTYGEWLAWQCRIDDGVESETCSVDGVPRKRLYVLDLDGASLGLAALALERLRALWGPALPVVGIVSREADDRVAAESCFSTLSRFCLDGGPVERARRLCAFRDYWLRTVALPAMVAPRTPVPCVHGSVHGPRLVPARAVVWGDGAPGWLTVAGSAA